VRHFSWIVTIPMTVAVVVFALANRHDVVLYFWPFPWTRDLPLFVIVLCCLLIGFLLGAILAWMAGAPRRRRARQTAERARDLARQVTELQRRQQAAERAASVEAGRLAAPGAPPSENGPSTGRPGTPTASLEHLSGV
jgi:uncharacterized integral membrane protein